MNLEGEFLSQYSKGYEIKNWKYCVPIQKEKTLELTLEQIAEKFNVSVENLKIKK